MKKHATFITVLMMAIVLSVTGSLFAADKAGEILVVSKDVYIIRDDTKNTAEPRMALQSKDAVVTDRNSRTKLFFIDDSILNLGELSKVEVEEYMYDSEKGRSKSVYKLIDGSLRVVVGRSDLEVHTETAVAAARGTKFVIWEEATGSADKDADTQKNILLASNDESFPVAAGNPLDKKKMLKTCIKVLDGKVELKSTNPDNENKLMVERGNAGCVTYFEPPEIAIVPDGKGAATLVSGPVGSSSGPMPTQLGPIGGGGGPDTGGTDVVGDLGGGDTIDPTPPDPPTPDPPSLSGDVNIGITLDFDSD